MKKKNIIFVEIPLISNVGVFQFTKIYKWSEQMFSVKKTPWDTRIKKIIKLFKGVLKLFFL